MFRALLDARKATMSPMSSVVCKRPSGILERKPSHPSSKLRPLSPLNSSTTLTCRSVATMPGWTELTVMSYWASSAARLWVMPTMANFDAE